MTGVQILRNVYHNLIVPSSVEFTHLCVSERESMKGERVSLRAREREGEGERERGKREREERDKKERERRGRE